MSEENKKRKREDENEDEDGQPPTKKQKLQKEDPFKVEDYQRDLNESQKKITERVVQKILKDFDIQYKEAISKLCKATKLYEASMNTDDTDELAVFKSESTRIEITILLSKYVERGIGLTWCDYGNKILFLSLGKFD